MQWLWGSLLDLIFPKYCLSCGAEGAWLCQQHRETLPVNEEFYCFVTGAKTAFGNMSLEIQKESALDGLIIVSNYEHEIIQKLIHALKYNFVTEIAPIVGGHMAQFMQKNNVDAIYVLNPEQTIVVPVPIHKKRMLMRGFNQSELIAGTVASQCKYSLCTDVLYRIRATHAQADLRRADRVLNVQKAFQASALIAGTTVLLIDDVITTGHTLEEAAAALKEAGAVRVLGLVFAHRRT